MDPETLTSMARWPNVPACYGWLTLDARGQWRLGEGGGELVRHAGLADYLNRNYAATERGEWFVQNGPQRVYVTLTRAPYIVRLVEGGVWQTHTGLAVHQVTQVLLDAEGHVYAVCEHGLAGIDDRDLSALLDLSAADEDVLDGLAVNVGEHRLPLESVAADTLPGRFGFVLQPVALKSEFNRLTGELASAYEGVDEVLAQQEIDAAVKQARKR